MDSTCAGLQIEPVDDKVISFAGVPGDGYLSGNNGDSYHVRTYSTRKLRL